MNPTEIRRLILRMALAGDSAHIGSALSVVEILIALYDRTIESYDVVLLSKAHAAMALYAIQYARGELNDSDLECYLKDGTRLSGHAYPFGALGHGLSVGVGMALAQKRNYSAARTFVVLGDGELNEGSCWEAIMAAAQWRLNNLYVIVDANMLQGLGATTDIMELRPIAEKFSAFGWVAREVQCGNDVSAVHRGLSDITHAAQASGKPKALICHTTKGAGVSFMANNNDWHYRKLSRELYDEAMAQLESQESA